MRMNIRAKISTTATVVVVIPKWAELEQQSQSRVKAESKQSQSTAKAQPKHSQSTAKAQPKQSQSRAKARRCCDEHRGGRDFLRYSIQFSITHTNTHLRTHTSTSTRHRIDLCSFTVGAFFVLNKEPAKP